MNRFVDWWLFTIILIYTLLLIEACRVAFT